MNSNVFIKTIQDNSDRDINIVKSDKEYIPYMISYGSSPNETNTLKRIVNKLQSGLNKQLVELAIDKLSEKYPNKRRITIKDILAVLKELFPDRVSSWSIYYAKIITDRLKVSIRSTFIFPKNDISEIDRGAFLSDLFRRQHLSPTLRAING